MQLRFETSPNTAFLLNQLKGLISSDPMRLEVLNAVKQLKLPDCWVAAGFVRNMVWDYLHQSNSPLSDIDVIYYNAKDLSQEADLALKNQLKTICPKLPWSVKNQARMHLRNGDQPYQNCLDAMSHWPEKQTAIAVRLDFNNEIELMHCFSLVELFSLKITHNPIREKAIFDQRVESKGWLKNWRQLSID